MNFSNLQPRPYQGRALPQKEKVLHIYKTGCKTTLSCGFAADSLLFDHYAKKNGSNDFLPPLLPFTTILIFSERIRKFEGVFDEYQPTRLRHISSKQKQRKTCLLS